jgi:hypothetical protein
MIRFLLCLLIAISAFGQDSLHILGTWEFAQRPGTCHEGRDAFTCIGTGCTASLYVCGPNNSWAAFGGGGLADPGANGPINRTSAGVTAPATATNVASIVYCQDTGAANALACNLSPSITSYTAGLTVRVKAANANTGAATLNLNGLGAIAIKKNSATALVANDILSGQVSTYLYDGAAFQMQSLLGNAASGGAATTVNYPVYLGACKPDTTPNPAVDLTGDTATSLFCPGGTSTFNSLQIYTPTNTAGTFYTNLMLPPTYTAAGATTLIFRISNNSVSGTSAVNVSASCNGSSYNAVASNTWSNASGGVVVSVSGINMTGCVASQQVRFRVDIPSQPGQTTLLGLSITVPLT